MNKDPGKSTSIVSKNQVIFAVCFWVVIVTAFLLYFYSIDFDKSVLLVTLDQLFKSQLGFLLFLILYIIRPLIFFPATALTLLAGNIFGFPVGLVLTIIGSNASSSLAFLIGKVIFGKIKYPDKLKPFIISLQDNSFTTVLIARLTFMPYDWVSYIAGAFNINFVGFISATAIGSIIGTISIVSLGASLSSVSDIENVAIKPNYIWVSVVMIFISLGLSYFLKKRQKISAD